LRSDVRRLGLAARLLAALMLVVLTGVVTAWIVATLVAPPLFHQHLREADPLVTSAETHHAEQAFRSANGISLAVALLAAFVASVALSVYLARILQRSVEPLSSAVAKVARGRYHVRVPSPGVGSEFDVLAGAVNQLAEQLQAIEVTRRRLLADLAHELRTPIATLDAYLEGLEDGVASLDGETVTVLRAQVSRLTRLADDLSAVSRAEEHRLELRRSRVAVADLVSAAVDGVRDRFTGMGVELRGDVAPGTGELLVDVERVGQVLGNLLDNALRHTPERGTVTVGARPVPGGVELVVTDTGDGISADHLPHVFERFYRVDAARDREHGGSGIGLTIARSLVEAHGGSVGVTSPGPGRGTTFTVTLPRTGRPSAPEPRSGPAAASDGGPPAADPSSSGRVSSRRRRSR